MNAPRTAAAPGAADVRAVLGVCERITRDAGLAAGLAVALSGRNVTAIAPGRYAAVPVGDVPAGAVLRTHSLAATEGVAFVECRGERPVGGNELGEIGRLVAAVRLGLVRRLLDQAVEHLSNRLAGDAPLIRKQLVTGAVADVIAEVELLRAYACSGHGPDAIGDLHTRLDDVGWQVATLFGAAGYITDHPGRALYVSALIANTWVDRAEAAK